MTTQATQGAAGVMMRLRTETAEHHARAEGKALQQKMVRGQISRGEYAGWLGQMYLVHRALENAVERVRNAAAVLSVITDEQTHSRRLAVDLAFFGVKAGDVKASSATARLIARIDQTASESPMGVLGMHYVLEGSMNGNKYIAMAVSKGLQLNAGPGLSYLDPYADRQRGVWAEWKAKVDGFGLAEADADRAVEGAKAMFDGIAEVCENV